MSTKKTTKTTKAKSATTKPRKKTTDAAILATCPVNGAGWCPYPFSAAQLKKRLERLKKEQELAGAGVSV